MSGELLLLTSFCVGGAIGVAGYWVGWYQGRKYLRAELGRLQPPPSRKTWR